MRRVFIFILLVAVFAGCAQPGNQSSANLQEKSLPQPEVEQPVDQAVPAAVEEPVQPAAVVEQEQAPTLSAPAPTATAPAPVSKPTSQPVAQVDEPVSFGPDSFPEGINPLTGLLVENSENLALSPALVSVTNFPVTARPQAGLSYSPVVFEMYIGEGMTRFLALFYGDYPQKGADSGMTLADDKIGPVRSGRLPYESLRQLYNGFLVMASASPNVLTGLGSYSNVFGSDTSDINSALVSATKLEEIASSNDKRLTEDALSGLKFETGAPEGGKTGTGLWIPFNYLNQVIWRFDQASGAYHRYQDNADGQTFVQATDRLNKQPLTYENVVILFANHEARRETLIDIDLMYIDKMPALLFRDGKMYEIYWTTANAEYEKTTGRVRPIRFVDAQGNPFPLKPGQTWVEIVQQFTPYNETVDSQVYFDLKTKKSPGSGNWAIHFFPTVPERQ